MKIYGTLGAFILALPMVLAQNVTPASDFNIRQDGGLQFSFNEGAYQFEMGGFFQPAIIFEQAEGAERDLLLNSKRSFFRFGGRAINERVSFMVQTNFSDRSPLYDAWMAYHPTKTWTIYMGQRQTFANNLEMRYREDRLHFTDRGLVSTQLSRTGREFGLFVEGAFGEKFGISPMFAITSGDGRNSFGVDSRDVDLGGLKYAARLDVFPFGHFTAGNELYSSDLMHEQKLKVLFGAAASYNSGASGTTGEGHGDFLLYNENGTIALPNYRQIYVDFLAKYKGFSFLVEYGNASANGVRNRFTDAEAIFALTPGQISTYLALGTSFNTQLGYVTTQGYSVDFRYGRGNPEFAIIAQSQLQEVSDYTVGVSRFFKGHNLKLQASYSLLQAPGGNRNVMELMMQFAF
jgi:hypothetical protein